MDCTQPQTQPLENRLRWITFGDTEDVEAHQDLIQGLRQPQKTLPCRYLYDDRGSALFEQICDLPEYYPTRTEQALLETCAIEITQLTGVCELVELGSGSSRKTRLLLDAYSRLHSPLQYCPIDVSGSMLKATALELLHQYPTLQLCGLEGTYERALSQLPPRALENRLLIFLGSTLGNLDETAYRQFLMQIQKALQPGEFLLLGIDLQKSIPTLTAAYNDAQGVTAAFNLNVLRHLNQQFNGNFDLDQFVHLAFYNTAQHQIEMHLKSLMAQTVVLKALDHHMTLQAGETIHTESSRKFHLSALMDDLASSALQPLQVWTDPQGWFGLVLCQRQCASDESP